MRHSSRFGFALIFVLTIGVATVHGRSSTPLGQDEYETLKTQAERFYAEGSFSRALELYRRVEKLELDEYESRWVKFRIGDAMWRNQAATRTNDGTIFERAQAQLQSILTEYKIATDRDDVWAKVHESLGDYWWDRRDSQNWHQGWSHYAQALDYWAGSRDLEQARKEYLAIVFRAAEPAWLAENPYYRQYVQVPANVLENAVKIAERDPDLAHAEYLLAMSMRNQGGWRQQQRVEELFQKVVDRGKTTEWYDDALFYYAEWISQRGRPVRLEGGQWATEPDYPKALALYQQLVRDFDKGDTAHFDQARNRIREITSPALTVSVSNVFLPGSEVQFHLYSRNIRAVDFAIHKIDLPRDVSLPATNDDANWLKHIDLARASKARSWNHPTGDKGDHRPRNEVVALEEKLEPGAYLIEATAGGLHARDILLISQTSIVMKSVADQALVYVCDAIDGSPVPGATVALWEVRNHHDNRNNWRWAALRHSLTTNDEGLAVTDLKYKKGHGTILVFASKGDQQAFNLNNVPAIARPGDEYRIYAVTDRPAYRPGQDVSWKITARVYRDSTYTTPGGKNIKYEIKDPRGTKLDEGTLALNEFGSAWSKLTLKDDATLGEYQALFWTAQENSHIGNATLFRLEEYKLPEFKVTVATAEDERGRPKAFQIGDTIEAKIQAEYYFGGPVANADVEVIVYQRPYWFWWQAEREYPWLYEDSNPYRWYYYGHGQQMKREQIQTDERGVATITFDTPLNTDQDFEYTIEARVVDASRREVVESGTIRVTRQRYFVEAKPEHNIYRPQEEVTIAFTAKDANQNAIEAEGLVTVFRDEWREIWIAPDGREVMGDELDALKQKMRPFPPIVKPGEPQWRLKYRGYKSEQVLQRAVRTDSEGQAELAFKAPREGFYRIEWVSEKNDLYPVTAHASVWVCDDATRSIGYYHGGIDIIVDKDTFKVGEHAPIMISVPIHQQYVLFTVEGNDLHDYRLVHVEGTVKLLHVEVRDAHIPNIWLAASMVQDGNLYSDAEHVTVPPDDHFLDVNISLSKSAYLPGESGTLNVTTKDAEGRPVAAEVSLAVIDESLYYIQQELARDPREFFYSDRQHQRVGTSSSMYQKQFARLIKDAGGNVVHAHVRADSELGELEHFDRDELGRGEVRERAANAPMASEAMMDAAKSGGRGRGAMGGGGFGGGFADDERLARRQEGNIFDAPAEEAQRIDHQGEDSPNVRVRSDFRETALWLPSVITNDSGTATVEVDFPDSTTTWRATARAFTKQTDVGIGAADARTRQPLIVRLQAPRFFVVNDYTTISAVMNNNTEEAFAARYDVDITGLDLLEVEIDGRRLPLDRAEPVTIPANGAATVNWRVAARAAGEAKIIVRATAGEFGDAMEKTYTVYEHGIEKHITKAGKVRGEDVTISIDLPPRKEGSTHMQVQVTPSMAATMLDALPYLIDYPYGCTEQTMSRFLPAAITARTLSDLGIDPADAMQGVFGGIEREFVDKTQPRGKRDLAKLDQMVRQGLARLYDFQHGDGGWGWWKEGDSDHYMSAYVVWGLALAKNAGIEIDDAVLARGVEFLRKEIIEQERALDMQAWLLHALAAAHHARGERDLDNRFEARAFDNLWTGRNKLNSYTRALLALAAHYYNKADEAQTLVRNLENGVKIDESPDTSVIMRGPQQSHPAVIATAHWGEDGIWYRWSDGGVESTAFALRALLAIDPDHKLIEPVTNWLIKNRRGAQWSNTKDTAIVVLTMTDYLKTTGELDANQEIEILVNGSRIAQRTITPQDLFSGPRVFDVNSEIIRDGKNDVRIVRRSGEGPIYFMVDAEFFSMEEPIEAAGHEIFVRRDYYKLVPYPTLLKGYEFDRVPMKDGDSVRSGERIEVVLTVESKNNYEYLLFEDLKPAGLEAVQVKSGKPLYAKELKLAGIERRFANEPGLDAQDIARDSSDYTGRSAWTYQELRDRNIALFINRLPEGTWELSYELRAEVPGEFHALPVLAQAMYVPEIRANSREIRMTVYERE